MIKLKETIEYRVDSEDGAIRFIESERKGAADKGYTVTKAAYSLKQKKSKGEVIDQGYLVTITYEYLKFWDEL